MTETEQKEKMNELMNKISFALKDAALAQGFEIICKRIAELEKENENLKEVNEAAKQELIEARYRNSELKKENDCYKALDSHYEEIEEDAKVIAKENAELKEKLKNEISFNERSETVKKYQEQINELKAHCKAVDDVNEKMKCGGNCRHGYYVNTGGCYDMKCRLTYCDCINCNDKWELAE